MTDAPSRDRGMTLIEVVVAMVLLGILATATVTVIMKAQETSVANRSRVAAANLAAREIEMTRAAFSRTDTAPREIADAGTVTNPNPLEGQTAGQPLRVDGRLYTVTRSVAWNVVGEGASACDGGALVKYPSLGVTVTVTWADMGVTAPVVSRTALAPAKGVGIQSTSSFVAVKVLDSSGQPNEGRSIRVSGAGSARTGVTDNTGCAVVEVTPGASGTEYTAQAVDTGYVDVSGGTQPSKVVGVLKPGTLNNSVSFAYDRAGSLRLRLIGPDGAPVDGGAVAGSTVTLVSSQFSGESGLSKHAVTGTSTTIGNLWPAQYGAYFGDNAPPGGYTSVAVSPGGTADLDVSVGAASSSIADLPGGATSAVVVPVGVTSCTDAAARPVDPAGFTLIPGSWNFFASGPNFDCSPGPVGVQLDDGANEAVRWEQTSLRVVNAPEGALWAVSRSRTGDQQLTSCPGPDVAGFALPVDGARTGPLPLPAGDWWVYVTDGAAAGGCVSTPGSQYSKVVEYGTPTTLTWPVASTVLEVTGVRSGASVVIHPTPLTGTQCRQTGDIRLGPAPRNNTAYSTTVSRPGTGTQTWYVYSLRNNTCSAIGQFVVGTATTELSKTFTDTGKVGP